MDGSLTDEVDIVGKSQTVIGRTKEKQLRTISDLRDGHSVIVK